MDTILYIVTYYMSSDGSVELTAYSGKAEAVKHWQANHDMDVRDGCLFEQITEGSYYFCRDSFDRGNYCECVLYERPLLAAFEDRAMEK